MSEFADSPDRVPLRTVLVSMAVMWLCYFLLTTLRGSIFGFDLQNELLWRRGLVCLAGVAVTFALWIVVRLFDRQALWKQVVFAVVLALPASLLVAQINERAFADVEGKAIAQLGEKQGVSLRLDEAGNLLLDLPGVQRAEDAASDGTITLARAPTGADRWRQLSGVALGPYFLLLAWAALYFALLAGAQARAAERREGEFRRAAKAAELRSLRYQVNPHFLFNTLNSLSALVMTGKAERAEEMIQTISSFYRHSLADDPTSDVELVEEFALQRHYLAIEAVRFPDRLRTKVEMPAELATARIPGMIMQPMIENSVKYAVARVTRPVTITLAASEEYGRLVLSVADDGPGSPEAHQRGLGIGLANVRERLQARFGNEASFESGPVPGGYRTELRLPLVRHG